MTTATVLLAEDDADIRALVTLVLERLGLEVQTFDDGTGVLEACRERRPDLVILDVTMPRLSGLEVCRAIRADATVAGTPILLMTARARDEDVRLGLEAGADGYVVKPFSPGELSATVSRVLARTA